MHAHLPFEGIRADFVQKFDELVQQLIDGHPLTLTRQADKLCQSGQNCGLCHAQQSAKRDEQALTAINHVLGINGERESFRLDLDTVNTLRHGFADGTLRQACHGCAWFTFCSSVAVNDFHRAHLQFTT